MSGVSDQHESAYSHPISYKLVHTVLTDNIALVDQGDIVDVTEAGVLYSVGGIVANSVTGGPVGIVEVAIDGLSQITIPIYSGDNTWDQVGAGAYKQGSLAGGATAQHNFIIQMNVQYKQSLRVSHDVTTGADGGVIRIHVLRGIEQ